MHDYPKFKLALNRVVNIGIRILFRSGYNDTTNAFKAYRREVIETVQPLLSNHFNLTVEIPLKAIVRGHTLQGHPDLVAQPQGGRVEALAAGDGQSVRLHRPLRACSSGISAAATTGDPGAIAGAAERARERASTLSRR